MRGAADASVDQLTIGSIETQIAGPGEYTEFGLVRLSPGAHQLLIHYESKPLSPGTGTPAQLPYPSGPILISSAPDDPSLRYVPPSEAGKLCGRRWDWLEVVRNAPPSSPPQY